jgi:hypothetical protein
LHPEINLEKYEHPCLIEDSNKAGEVLPQEPLPTELLNAGYILKKI